MIPPRPSPSRARTPSIQRRVAIASMDWHAAARANQSIEAIATLRCIDGVLARDGDGLGGIIKAWVKAGNVISLSIRRSGMLIAHAKFETQATRNLPSIGHVCLNVRESEMPSRVRGRFRVLLIVPEQSVGQGVARRIGVATIE